MLLAADVGGTKTLIGTFDATGPRPRPVITREYPTLDFDSLNQLVQAFVNDTGDTTITAACAGVAGPVEGHRARLTNVPWVVDIALVSARFDDCPAALLNDLEAMAYAVPVLDRSELLTLQRGEPNANGNAALIAAGTGLGEALLHCVDGRFLPLATEAGHADFPARNPREIALVEMLLSWYGRVEVEHVVSGPGILNIFRFTHGTRALHDACAVVGSNVPETEMSAAITSVALEGRCPRCVETLTMFVSAYGAEAGNLGLRGAALAGVYLGGGIAPKILPALQDGHFMKAFLDKTPMEHLVRRMSVQVILNQSAGLLGAAVRAAEIAAHGGRRS